MSTHVRSTMFVEVLCLVFACKAVLCVIHGFAIISLRKRELVALLYFVLTVVWLLLFYLVFPRSAVGWFVVLIVIVTVKVYRW